LKTKLITAAEARGMREECITNFKIIGMDKYIKHINKIVKDATSEGKWVSQTIIHYYPDANYDKVLDELSNEKMQVLIEHLKENGYQAMVYNNCFYLSWDIPEEKPAPVKEEPKKKSWWEMYWNCWNWK
jgi:hypothetical protein